MSSSYADIKNPQGLGHIRQGGLRYCLRTSFCDVDDFCEAARGWSLEFQQLDRGPLSADLLLAGTDTTQIGRTRLSRQFEQHGATPDGMRTFGLLEENSTGVSWFRQNASKRDLMSFPSERSFEALSPPGFDVYTLAISEQALWRAAQYLGLEAAMDRINATNQLFRGDDEVMRELRWMLRKLSQALSQRQPRFSGERASLALNLLLPELLLKVIASAADHEIPTPPMRMRDRAVKRAIEFLTFHPTSIVSTQELCHAAGASSRTLEYAFRERFNVSPKAYMQARRFNSVRQDLRAADPINSNIWEIAAEWGFWHMGQFARDYRSFFSELPSATLAKPAGRLSAVNSAS